ncbi:hypothetical protein [Legionella pneumophila]|uniref:hypothetical protein n=1 Tax=Legionella pneumophila TaxID=446 RepID=UPI0012B68F25|nr:hypothetical protein [Legionella pneumophila]
MPSYKIIMMDNGSKNSQYDFHAVSNGHSIALEVSQAINRKGLELGLHLQKAKNKFRYNKLKFEWIININKNAKKIEQIKIEPLLKEIEFFCFKNGLAEFKLSDIHNRYPELSKTLSMLRALGVINILGKYTLRGGDVKIYQFISSSYNPMYLINIMAEICNKDDNKEKLSASNADERHFFIPISADNEAAFTIQSCIDQLPFKIPISEISPSIPDFIDCVWLSTLINFTPNKEMGYILIKVTKDACDYKFQNASDGIGVYRIPESDMYIA